MRTALRFLAANLIAGTVIWWLAAGANPGWYKDQVPVKRIDEVTGLEGITYEKRFVPGVDILALACVTSAALTGLSFLFSRKPPRT